MTAIGDAVAGVGGGADAIDRVSLAIGQMQAKGRVQSEELLQLAEAGVPPTSCWASSSDSRANSWPSR
jgi:tape measure domain-containing protein